MVTGNIISVRIAWHKMATNDYRKVGYEKTIGCGIHKLEPINLYRFVKLPIWKQNAILRRWHGEPMKWKAVRYFRCYAIEIDNPDKLALRIRQLVGFGRFMFGIDGYHDNREHSDTFICTKSECKYFIKCKLHKRHQQGWSCRANPKTIRRFFRYCEIEILAKNENIDYNYNNEIDFTYSIRFENDKLDLLKWFNRY